MKIADLYAKCQELEIDCDRDNGKDYYLSLLRGHFLKRDYPKGLPYPDIAPMLCYPAWHLKPGELEQIYKSPEWKGQEKLNGCRVLIHFVRDVGLFILTRTISVRTFRYEEVTASFLFYQFIPKFNASLDAEAMAPVGIDTRGYTAKGDITTTTLHSVSTLFHLDAPQARRLQKEQHKVLTLRVLDIMRWGGRDVTELTLDERDVLIGDAHKRLRREGLDKFFLQVPYEEEDKVTAFQKIVEQGGEGLVLKHRKSLYLPDTRSRKAWIKVKKRIRMLAFVTGFERGKEEGQHKDRVGALKFSAYDERGQIQEVAVAGNLELAFRKQISLLDLKTKKLTLDPKLYGRVAQISGQEWSGRKRNLVHATFDGWENAGRAECLIAEAQ